MAQQQPLPIVLNEVLSVREPTQIPDMMYTDYTCFMQLSSFEVQVGAPLHGSTHNVLTI